MKMMSEASSVVDNATVTSPKSFPDLPPEIRNKIYGFLFRGAIVMIRGRVAGPIGREHQQEQSKRSRRLNRQRGRALGLGIILASKACFAEAKPMLLAQATFRLKLVEFPLTNRRAYTGGLSELDLGFVHSVMISDIASASQSTIYSADMGLVTPSLRELFVHNRHSIYLTLVLDDLKTITKCDDLLNQNDYGSIRQLWRSSQLGQLLRHVKKVGAQNDVRAKFIFVQRASLGDWRTVVSTPLCRAGLCTNCKQRVYFDLVEEVFWVECQSQKKILVPKRALPGMIDAIMEDIEKNQREATRQVLTI